MKVKIFSGTAWNTGSIETDVNRWLEKNDVDIIDMKTTGTEDKVICFVMYEEKPIATTQEDAMIETARAGATMRVADAALFNNVNVPKETQNPSPCGFCSLCPADTDKCPITGKNRISATLNHIWNGADK